MRKEQKTWTVTLTDTFGGELNYAWARTATVSAATMRGAVRAGKARLGISGSPYRYAWRYGTDATLFAVGACLALTVEQDIG